MDHAPKPLSKEFEVNIAKGIIFSLMTCGIYYGYWNYLQFKAMNQLLGRDEFDFTTWLVLTLITCGLFHIYYEYKMGSELQRWLAANGHEVSPNLSLIGLGLAVFGLPIAADAIYQHELNRLVG